MSGFAVGLNAGVNLGSTYLQAKRQEVLDERAARDDAQKQSDLQRTLEMRGESDAAYKSFSNLQANGVSDGSKADFSGTAPEAEYGPVPQSQMAPVRGLREPGSDPTMPAPQVPSRAATGLEYNGAAQRIAVANRDMAAFGSLQKEGKDLSFEADFKKHYKEYVGDAAQIGETATYVNQSSKSMSMGEPDANGFIRMSIVKPDGKADFLKLNKADQAKLYAGVKLMENNPEKALSLIAGVNTNLAAAVAQENGIAFQAGKENNDTSFNKGQLAQGAEKNRIALINAQRERGGGGGGGGAKVDQKYVAALNDLNTRINETNDPAEVKKLEREYQRVQSLAYTDMGKVAPLKEARATRPDFSPKEYADTLTKFVGSGMSPTEARIEADTLYGRAPAAAAIDSKLQGLNKDRPAARAPIIVQPGQQGMRDSSQTIQGDPQSFVRVSKRGVFGGVDYGYQDPVTKKVYSTAEYNKLSGQ